jgi:hypothetical protein
LCREISKVFASRDSQAKQLKRQRKRATSFDSSLIVILFFARWNGVILKMWMLDQQ